MICAIGQRIRTVVRIVFARIIWHSILRTKRPVIIIPNMFVIAGLPVMTVKCKPIHPTNYFSHFILYFISAATVVCLCLSEYRKNICWQRLEHVHPFRNKNCWSMAVLDQEVFYNYKADVAGNKSIKLQHDYLHK